MPAKQKWVVEPPPDPELVREYSDALGLAPVVVSLALQRGFYERESLERFFYPRLKDLSDPFKLPGVEKAVLRLIQAIDGRESVVLYGDYDVDGVTSVALLSNTLRAFGLEPLPFLPTRMEEGYGLSAKGIETSLNGSVPDLLIAADCGTNSRDEAVILKEQGIDLIILDHHEPDSAGTAECVALVNPKLGDDYHYLCTAGVVFKVVHALLKSRPLPDFDLKDQLDLVALGTIADIVPLKDENRIVARRGLAQLDCTIHSGVAALKKVAGVSTPARAHDVGFKLGPRLNAAGRLDKASASLELLLCRDSSDAQVLAEGLDQQNRDRQALELKTREEAEQMIHDLPSEQRSHAIVVGSRGWHPGVVGIVASRISRQYHRPTFVVGIAEDGLGKGSGRSVKGVSLVRALDSARDVIEAGGGHEMAAGVSVREEKLEEFRIAFVKNVAEQVDNDTLIPKLVIDREIMFKDLNLDLLDSYELLRPFGAGNPQPLFMSRGVEPVQEPRVIKEKHLKYRFYQNGIELEGIYFNGLEKDIPKPGWDIAYTIDRNEWRGRVKLNMVIQAIRKASKF
ncbi:MAG: single-stranded-DNA-specific exonuclease RecJ [Verrucomicrobiales bacterium]|jgi:single-stranded-DNA-specific exonuclease|nr:single-stranded-DNA-specific exonuclease RecJ [Verrucomicrobiales bacterium]|tara:strand:+ start:27309 stop:29012 length:1704 start_codon:yes stop_codon:yes gene_type:complete